MLSRKKTPDATQTMDNLVSIVKQELFVHESFFEIIGKKNDLNVFNVLNFLINCENIWDWKHDPLILK
jgi:hypothetical protein